MNCKICGNSETTILTTKLRRGQGKVWFCPKCEYGMLEPLFSDYRKYYDEEYRKVAKDNLEMSDEESPDEIYNSRVNFQNDRLNIISNYYDMQKDFLEIGCSAGQFLIHVKDKFRTISGIEFSTKCAEFCEKQVGTHIYTEDISKVEFSEGGMFDYIAFFQVLEHIEDPTVFLNDVSCHLKENGRVFIEVPNLYDPLLSLWKVPFYEEFYFHEAHLHYFSKKALRKLMEKCGFEIEHTFSLQDYNLFNHIWWQFNNKPQSNCEFGLNEPRFELKNKMAEEELNLLLQETNKRYYKILQKYENTSNIFIIAKRK